MKGATSKECTLQHRRMPAAPAAPAATAAVHGRQQSRKHSVQSFTWMVACMPESGLVSSKTPFSQHKQPRENCTLHFLVPLLLFALLSRPTAVTFVTHPLHFVGCISAAAVVQTLIANLVRGYEVLKDPDMTRLLEQSQWFLVPVCLCGCVPVCLLCGCVAVCLCACVCAHLWVGLCGRGGDRGQGGLLLVPAVSQSCVCCDGDDVDDDGGDEDGMMA